MWLSLHENRVALTGSSSKRLLYLLSCRSVAGVVVSPLQTLKVRGLLLCSCAKCAGHEHIQMQPKSIALWTSRASEVSSNVLLSVSPDFFGVNGWRCPL